MAPAIIAVNQKLKNMKTLFKSIIFTTALLSTAAGYAQTIDTNKQAAEHFFCRSEKSSGRTAIMEYRALWPDGVRRPENKANLGKHA